jgi:benzoyl-CoA 2,3-epoxidase subunit A
MVMFFGARTPEELPYFGPLQKVPDMLLEKDLVFSRLPGQSKEYVQDRMRSKSERVGPLLKSKQTHVFICGLKGMEQGIEEAFVDICSAHGLDWGALKPSMRAAGRYHVETY